MRPKAEWAFDSEPIRARGIILKLCTVGAEKNTACFFAIILTSKRGNWIEG